MMQAGRYFLTLHIPTRLSFFGCVRGVDTVGIKKYLLFTPPPPKKGSVIVFSCQICFDHADGDRGREHRGVCGNGISR